METSMEFRIKHLKGETNKEWGSPTAASSTCCLSSTVPRSESGASGRWRSLTEAVEETKTVALAEAVVEGKLGREGEGSRGKESRWGAHRRP